MSKLTAAQIADEAVGALLEEVHLTPKPGLVDEDNCGAHSDMTLELFEHSAECLRGYFETAFTMGLQREQTMPELQQAGLEAEKTMYSVTGGVNTHKGAIYSFGLLLSALGSCQAFGAEPFSVAAALAAAGKPPKGATHGNEVREKHPRAGARQEALDGFPNVLSAYNVLEETGSAHMALLWLIASVPDTNVLYRGGDDGLTFVQSSAKRLLMRPEPLLPQLRELDRAFNEKGLSPGGCADLLAAALLLRRTKPIWDPD